MPIDVTEPQSDGWWLQQCWEKFDRRERRDRLDRLHRYYAGDPPLPPEMEKLRPALKAFMRIGRTNFAETIVNAPMDRMQIVGVRTSADSSEEGDRQAWRLWRRAGLPVESKSVHQTMGHLGDGYAIVGWDAEDDVPVVTSEDPRQCVTIHDPAQQRKVLAGAKFFYDPAAQRDLAYLYLPGRVRVAVHDRKASSRTAQAVRFSAQAWDWSDEVDSEPLGGSLPSALAGEVVIRRFRNRDGVGEFERHTDLLDRINHEILRRLVIMSNQAYRQRAIKGDLPDKDPETGAEIDYDQVFSADPLSLWLLPSGVDIQEMGQADLTPVLSSVKDDVLHLAVATQTPMAMFTPDASTQTAEGASFQREGLSYRTEDRIARVDPSWAQVWRLMFLWAGMPDRANLEDIEPIWAPVERYSLAEMGSAWSQMADMPFKTKARLILRASPTELARMETERLDEQVLAAQLAAQQASAQPRQG